MSKQKLSKLVTILGRTFNQQLSKEHYYAYELVLLDEVKDFEGLCKKAVKSFERMPSPKQLLDISRGNELSSKQKSVELMGQLKLHIQKHGYYNFENAKRTASPMLWSLVQKLGGWSNACRINLNDSSAYAQARDFAEVILLKTKTEFAQLKSKSEIRALRGQR